MSRRRSIKSGLPRCEQFPHNAVSRYSQSVLDLGDEQLYWQLWSTFEEPLGLVILVHGYGDHSGYYSSIVDVLVTHGISVTGLDLPGHGKSSGARGHLTHWAQYHEAIAAFMHVLR